MNGDKQDSLIQLKTQYLKKCLKINEELLERFYTNPTKQTTLKDTLHFFQEKSKYNKNSLLKEIEEQKQKIEFLENWMNGNRKSSKELKNILFNPHYNGAVKTTPNSSPSEHVIAEHSLIANFLHDFLKAKKYVVTKKEFDLYVKRFAYIVRILDCDVFANNQLINDLLKSLHHKKIIELSEDKIIIKDYSRISRMGSYNVEIKSSNKSTYERSVFDEEKKAASKLIVKGLIHSAQKKNVKTK